MIDALTILLESELSSDLAPLKRAKIFELINWLYLTSKLNLPQQQNNVLKHLA